MTGRRTLLLVAPTFAPDPVVAAVRATEWARHLPDHGWDVVVATRWTQPEDGDRPERVVVEHVGPRTVGGLRSREPTRDLGARSAPGARRRLKRGVSRLVVPDGAAAFWRAHRDDIATIGARHRVDALVTTSPPHSLQAVGRPVADTLGVPWIADLRDPYLADARFRPTGLAAVALPWHRRFERAIYDADAVVHANAEHDRVMRTQHPDRADRMHVITNGFPDRMLDRLGVVAPAGTVVSAGRCDPAVLPRLVEAAAARGLVVHLVGPASAEAVARAAAHPDHLVVHGRRPHDEVLDLVASARVLVASLPAAQREGLGLTSKLFEYMATGRPILLVHPMPADRALVERHYAGGTRTIDDPTGPDVDAALAAALAGELDVAPEVRDRVRADLRRSAGARRLADLLDGLVAPGAPGASAPAVRGTAP
ncbi:MAG TPA: glycosyltransferase [Iamia sp.]